MAIRYWVGGTGTWNDTNTTNWSASSGGAGGASVPTAADNVVFDSASNAIAYTVTFGAIVGSFTGSITNGSTTLNVTVVTSGSLSVGQVISGSQIVPGTKIASFGTGSGGVGTYVLDTAQIFTVSTSIYTGTPVWKDMTVAGPAVGNVTLSGTSTWLNFGGNLTLSATGVTWSFSASNGQWFATNATLTNVITTNGISLNGFSSSVWSGIWNLGSAFSSNSAFNLWGNITFNTQNFNLTASNIPSAVATTRNITLGTSTLTSSSGFAWGTTGLTLSAASANLIITSATGSYSGSSTLTFGSLSYTATTQGTRTLNFGGTFGNVSFSGLTAVGLSVISVNTSFTVTGTLTVSAPTTTGTSRYNIASATVGTVVTITAGAVSLTDVDFSDITGAGAASWTGTRLGDAAGNSNITFPAAKTSYFVGTTSANWSTSQWAASSGGATASTNFPLPQDTATIDNSSLTAGNTLTINSGYNIGTLTCAARSTAMTLSQSASINIFGNYILSSSITISGTNNIQFRNRTSASINTAAVSLTQTLSVASVTGTISLAASLTTSQQFTLTSGILDFNAKTLTVNNFTANNSNVRSILVTGSTLNLTGNNASIFQIGNVTNLSVTGALTINCTYSGSVGTRTVVQGTFPSSSNATTLNVTAGSDIFVVNSLGVAQDINFSGYTGALTLPTSLSMYGSLTLGTGMSITTNTGSLSFIGTGTKTITTNAVPVNINLVLNSSGIRSFQDAVTMGTSRTITVNGGTVNFKNGTTNTATSFNFIGTISNQITIGSSTPSSQYTLSQTSGTVAPTYMTISDSNVTGGAIWNAYQNTGNINGGNNTGWLFFPSYAFSFFF